MNPQQNNALKRPSANAWSENLEQRASKLPRLDEHHDQIAISHSQDQKVDENPAPSLSFSQWRAVPPKQSLKRSAHSVLDNLSNAQSTKLARSSTETKVTDDTRDRPHLSSSSNTLEDYSSDSSDTWRPSQSGRQSALSHYSVVDRRRAQYTASSFGRSFSEPDDDSSDDDVENIRLLACHWAQHQSSRRRTAANNTVPESATYSDDDDSRHAINDTVKQRIMKMEHAMFGTMGRPRDDLADIMDEIVMESLSLDDDGYSSNDWDTVCKGGEYGSENEAERKCGIRYG